MWDQADKLTRQKHPYAVQNMAPKWLQGAVSKKDFSSARTPSKAAMLTSSTATEHAYCPTIGSYLSRRLRKESKHFAFVQCDGGDVVKLLQTGHAQAMRSYFTPGAG